MNLLTIVIPCYNEENTLEKTYYRLREIEDDTLKLEIIIVDDCSTDNSYYIAKKLAIDNDTLLVIKQSKNQGKGAALREGFKRATGDFVAVNDADLEYDPKDLKRLLEPLIEEHADVVVGSRFLSSGTHRVLYFWHYIGNKILTIVSNMFTDLNLTDMESGYKIFRREVIQSIDLKENRFGFEPEIIAKVAHQKLRIYEMGISYYGRTYDEGKKIGFKDAIRALYCIFRYNAHIAPIPIQILIYFFIGLTSAIFNGLLFNILINKNIAYTTSILIAFYAAALLNYVLTIMILFRQQARWNSYIEITLYMFLVTILGFLDIIITMLLIKVDINPLVAKFFSSGTLFMLNFAVRRFIVFPEPAAKTWKSQKISKSL